MIDHLVLATPDLAGTLAWLDREHGLAVVPGGQHLGWGTRNHLCSLGGGAYLEVIGPDPDQPEPGRPRPFGVDDLADPRLVAWAATTPDMTATLTAARAAGWEPGDDAAMSRTRPDGVVLRWRLTMPLLDDALAVRPFLIDWGTTEHPSASLPQPATLQSLEVCGDPALATHLAVLGRDDRVHVQRGAPLLRAVLARADGSRFELSSAG